VWRYRYDGQAGKVLEKRGEKQGDEEVREVKIDERVLGEGWNDEKDVGRNGASAVNVRCAKCDGI
jgi:hypothetical protein